MQVLSNMQSAGTITLALLQGPDVANLSPADFDLVVFPGGGGSAEAAGIGAAGEAAVKAFVRAGKGYYGTCAGAFLAGSQTCCDVLIPGYCNGRVGCVQSSYGMGLVDMGAAEPWDRGHGYVTMAYSSAAVSMLRLDATMYGPAYNTSVLYYQGPIQDKSYPGKFVAGASYTTEISSGHTQYTKGQMVGTPSLVTTMYGKGRVLLSSPHPEETIPRLDDVVEAYTLWAAGAI
jgi:glutamine amidotransferase-like uncharacterized protein